MSLRAAFINQDDELAMLGVPPLTRWWREGIGRWLDAYEQGRVLELWACVGRGAAKSTALYKLALFFTLAGDFVIPPGERHFAAILSRLKEEASKGIAIIDAWLALLGIPHSVAGDVVLLNNSPRGIRVVAASVAASSGWRAYFVGKDERGKWSTGGVEELDADEIDTSASAMTATHAYAPVCSFGSAWGAGGSFYEAIVGGSNEHRIILGPAATWVAAPHVSEESCRRKERHPGRFAREYECVFQAGDLAALTPDLVDPCFNNGPLTPLGDRVCAIDASSGRGDEYAWAFAGYGVIYSDPADIFLWGPPPLRPDGRPEIGCDGQPKKRGARLLSDTGHPLDNPNWQPTSEPILSIHDFDGIAGAFASHTSAATVVSRIAYESIHRGVRHVVGDQREAYAAGSLFAAEGMAFRECTWSAESKGRAVRHLQRLMGARLLHLGRDPQLREDLLALREVVRPSGAIVVTGRGGHIGDRGAVVMTVAMADLEGLITGSPSRTRGNRQDFGAGDFARTL